MEFCPNCGTKLNLVREKKEGKVTLLLVCPRCGYKKKAGEKLVLGSKVLKHEPQMQVTVIGKKEQRLRTMPTVQIECPKCGNNLAYVWQVQTRGSDESMTQFFRCTKCGYTFREYS
ncbi:transcription factor S [Candidatus Bathyarchaeota archaeon]|nr:MAG: transcription factor S [Candidatus Bathyarchaeota archaeon]